MNYYKDFDFLTADKLIKLAIKEDLGNGDVTALRFIDKKLNSQAVVKVKDYGIIAGLKIFKRIFKHVDPYVKVRLLLKDGDKVKNGVIVATLKGNTRSLLAAERLSLNLLQRMSGIATHTSEMISKLNNPLTKIIDTRKTTPNLRIFEKLAVKIGGGKNHRMGLYDMILIKDNHIEANGGIEKLLSKMQRQNNNPELKTEIEVRNIFEFEKVLKHGKGIIDVVLLDNFKITDLKKAVKMNDGSFEIEVSGNVNPDNIKKYSDIKGIDYISSGSLTHSVKSLDISLEFLS
ncbi:MAG: carboxylating nicotinate-nucleotide diphosphorylase [Ignavibacteria bacterium]|nr:MAG: carboxylating nicotinate-nucleotide diphosphorylase [Chlorobiota bacterium]MBV6399505.1 putative nicotinate-nucleotide pyrophosphorylase [carboxylating] [Ignavibacteria bacterium]MCC6886651.1 carboxylating nicotinate-nucleotide diphosphorylase [Ignavibacteriales bacterium]MCE7953210.1 carboxylating nicotinate-nucleotide diphosphorylase [Chlorobi bacterium CHB7]RIK50078.1 MAG: carboxylating nicotinate-nucleotide diphosphorylase [Ignavibacteriota bacterium]